MSWLQGLIFLAFILAPAVSWTIGKLRDQMEQKRLREEWQRRREEELRRGRLAERKTAPQPATHAQRIVNPDIEELAARRQEQIRRLREQQQREAATAAAQTRRRPGVTAKRPAAAPRAPRPTTPQPKPQQQQQRPRRPQPGVPYTPATRTRPGAQPPPVRPVAVVQQADDNVPRRLVDPRAPAESGVKMHALERRRREMAEDRQRRLGARSALAQAQRSNGVLGNITQRDLRKAVVMMEILSPPVSLRNE